MSRIRGIVVFGTAWVMACVSPSGMGQATVLVSHDAISTEQALGRNPSQGISEFAASADGRFVAFVSAAGNVVPGQVDENSSSGLGQASDVFLWDRQSGAIELVSHRLGDPATACGYVHPTAPAPANIGGGSRRPSISDDGRYVAFLSDCSDLVAPIRGATSGATGATYVYDRLSRAVELVSRCVEQCGTPAQEVLGGGSRPFISADGRYVLFDADPRVMAGEEGSAFASEFFIRDRQLDTVRLVHHLPDQPTRAANRGVTPQPIESAVMSANGAYVYFVSGSSDLTPGLAGTATALNIFVYDVASQVVTLASHRGAAVLLEANADSAFPSQRRNAVSADGRYLVYVSRAADLVALDGRPIGQWHHYVYDRLTNTSRLLDHAPGGPTVFGNGAAAGASAGQGVISDSGQWIAYVNTSTDLVPGASVAGTHLYLFNQGNGENQLLTHLPGQPLQGVGDGALRSDGLAQLDISADGRYIAYAAISAQLVSGQNAGSKTLGDCPSCLNDVFLYDRVALTQRLVTAAAGTLAVEANGHSGGASGAPAVQAPLHVSDDGTRVSYLNSSSNLISGQSDLAAGGMDVFQFDRTAAPPVPPPAIRNAGGGASPPGLLLMLLLAVIARRTRPGAVVAVTG